MRALHDLVIPFSILNGKLCEHWSIFRYSHNVESLYMGEIYSYTFTLVPAEMTTYNVLVIGG